MPYATRFLCLFAGLVLATATARAGVVVQHQGRLVDTNDTAVEGPQTLVFKLWKAPTRESTDGDVAVWTSSIDVVVTKGLYTAALGDKDAFPADAFTGNRWLSVTIGSNELTPRLKIGIAPSAARADVADLAKGLSCTACVADEAVVAVAGSKITGEVAKAAFATSAGALTGGLQGSAIEGAVAEATHAVSADGAAKLGGKVEADLSVATAAKLGGKAEADLNVATAASAARLDGRTPAELISQNVFAAANHAHNAAGTVDWSALKNVPSNLGGPPAGTIVFSKTSENQPLVDAGYKKSDLAPTITGGAWYGKASLPRDVRCEGLVAANGKVWSVGGFANETGGLTQVLAYDPALNTWDTRAPIPMKKWCLPAATADKKIYIAGGEATSSSAADRRASYVYDTTTNVWTPIAALPGSNHLTGFATMISNNTKLLLVGGYNQIAGAYDGAQVSEYDVANDGWVTRPVGPVSHHYGGGALGADGRVYVFGGYAAGDSLTAGQSLDIYTPSTRSWSKGASFPAPLYGLGAVAVGNLIVVTGGASAGEAPNFTTYVYDISLNSWSTLAPMPNRRWHHQATLLNGLIYAVGGYVGTSVSPTSGNTGLVDALGAPQALYAFEKL